MKTDDAKKKLCPLFGLARSMSIEGGSVRQACVAHTCALWRGDEKEGGCGLVVPEPSESLKKIDFAELAVKMRAAVEAAMTPPTPYRRGPTKHDA